MLQVVISPAKQMRAAQDAFEVLGIPPFARETARLHRALLDIERNEGSDSLQALWNVSDKLLGPCLNTLHEFGPILKNGDRSAIASISLARASRAAAASLSWDTVRCTCWFAVPNAFASSADTLSNEPALPSIAASTTSLAALSASLESLMPLLACSISCFVDSSTVPVCLSMPLADVSESDVELKMPASDVALA